MSTHHNSVRFGDNILPNHTHALLSLKERVRLHTLPRTSPTAPVCSTVKRKVDGGGGGGSPEFYSKAFFGISLPPLPFKTKQ